MTKQTPEDFLHALIETYDLAPANEPFKIHLDQINQLCNAEAILRSRANEIDDLNRMLDQAGEKLTKLEERFLDEQARNRALTNDLKEARNELLDRREKSEPHELIKTELDKAEYALKVHAFATIKNHDFYLIDAAIGRVFKDLTEHLTTPYSDIPF